MTRSIEGAGSDPMSEIHFDSIGDKYLVGRNRGKLTPISPSLKAVVTESGLFALDAQVTPEELDKTVELFQHIATPTIPEQRRSTE